MIKQQLAKLGKQNFMMQGGLLAMSGIIVRIIGMLYRIPMANIIGPQGSGIYSAAFNVYNIALILSSYGMPMAVSKLVSARLTNNQHRNVMQVALRALVVALITGGIAALILFFGAEGIENLLYSGIPGVKSPLKILAPTVLIVAVLGVFRGFFQGQGNMVPTAISQLVEQIVNAIVSVIASYGFMRAYAETLNPSEYGAMGGTLGTCLGAAAALAVVMALVIRNRFLYRSKVREDRVSENISVLDNYKLILVTVIPIIIGQTFYNVSAMIDDILFNKIMLMHTDEITISTLLGNYGQSFSTLTSIPMGIASAMSASMLPSVVRSFTQGNRGEINTKIRKTVRVTMIVAIPVMVALMVLGQPVVELLFRRFDAVQGSIMLKVGGAAIVFYTLSTITGSALQGIDKMRLPVRHSAIALAVHIPLVAILLAAGASVYALVIGVMVFACIVFVLNMRSLYKLNGYRQEISVTFMLPLFASAIMGIAALLIYRGLYTVIGHNLPVLIITGIAAVVIYFGIFYWLKKAGLFKKAYL